MQGERVFGAVLTRQRERRGVFVGGAPDARVRLAPNAAAAGGAGGAQKSGFLCKVARRAPAHHRLNGQHLEAVGRYKRV